MVEKFSLQVDVLEFMLIAILKEKQTLTMENPLLRKFMISAKLLSCSNKENMLLILIFIMS